MKVPKYIQNALIKRIKAAIAFNDSDLKVSQWCESHGIETKSYDTFGGVEAIVNPYDSVNRILKKIVEK